MIIFSNAVDERRRLEALILQSGAEFGSEVVNRIRKNRCVFRKWSGKLQSVKKTICPGADVEAQARSCRNG